MGQRLGQHFLQAPWAAAALGDAAGIQNGDCVLEIGPGTGALTGELLSRGASVIAIEKDKTLVTKLNELFAGPVGQGRLTVISDDIRNVTPESLGLSRGAYTIAANIPYYITGEIIRKFLSADLQPRRMVLLVQKEVAERIVGRGSARDKESILSLSVKAYGKPRLVRSVSRENFSPPPSVDSAILSIEDISRHLFRTVTEDDFFRVVKTGFASKRKVLRSNLGRISEKKSVDRAFQLCKLPRNARAEDVSLEKWFCLTKQLSGIDLQLSAIGGDSHPDS